MRLEDDDDAPVDSGACRGDDCGYFRRMMAVVVDHHDPSFLTAHLEAPLGAVELLERGSNPLEGHPGFESNRHRAECIQKVVAPWNTQAQPAKRCRR